MTGGAPGTGRPFCGTLSAALDAGSEPGSSDFRSLWESMGLLQGLGFRGFYGTLIGLLSGSSRVYSRFVGVSSDSTSVFFQG